jgi:ribosomal protein S18 acetylase RimI-like enzyme
MTAFTVRPLEPGDRAAWEPLWEGYQTFYKVQLPPETSDEAWRRFHDPAMPIYALGAFQGERLVGIVHYLFHLSTWTVGPYCYLQDLFTEPDTRGQGVGRALIEAVYAAAREAQASRVYWLTHETNAQAMALYDTIADRSGFVQYRKRLD